MSVERMACARGRGYPKILENGRGKHTADYYY